MLLSLIIELIVQEYNLVKVGVLVCDDVQVEVCVGVRKSLVADFVCLEIIVFPAHWYCPWWMV